MATRKEKFRFTLKRLSNVLTSIIKSKRGLLGISIIVFYSVLALSSPIIAPYPTVPYGSAKLGEPPIAEPIAIPLWYKYLPGGENVTENIYVTKGEVNPAEWSITNTSNAKVSYNPTFGNTQPGSLEMAFSGSGNASLTKDFNYPYRVYPKRFYGPFYYLINATFEGETLSFDDAAINIRVYFIHGPKSYQIYERVFTFKKRDIGAWSITMDADSNSPRLIDRLGYNPAGAVFTKPGSYSYKFEITFRSKEDLQLRNVKVFFDDTQLI